MADDKNARDDQARRADRRQRERDVLAELERWEETEPPLDPDQLTEFEERLAPVSFPATGAEVVASIGDERIEAPDGVHRVADLLPETEDQIFDDPETVRLRVQRPTVAAAMKRIAEAAASLEDLDRLGSQRDAYEKTLRALVAIDADDDDEGVRAVTDWIVERIEDKETMPGSRAVRKEAARYCRANGYEVRNDEWLGV
jgi:hypothetical protein